MKISGIRAQDLHLLIRARRVLTAANLNHLSLDEALAVARVRYAHQQPTGWHDYIYASLGHFARLPAHRFALYSGASGGGYVSLNLDEADRDLPVGDYLLKHCVAYAGQPELLALQEAHPGDPHEFYL